MSRSNYVLVALAHSSAAYAEAWFIKIFAFGFDLNGEMSDDMQISCIFFAFISFVNDHQNTWLPGFSAVIHGQNPACNTICLLYTSDAADE